MNVEDLGRKLAEIGFDLTPEELTQFAGATALARRLADLVTRDLPFAAGPTLILRLRRRVPR